MKYIVDVAGEHFEVEFRGAVVSLDGKEVDASLESEGSGKLQRLFVDGTGSNVEVDRVPGGWRVQVAGEHREVQVVDERVQRLRELTGAGGETKAGEVLKAPMPGLVLRMQVEVGQEVVAGDGILVLEAMKMENEIRAGISGAVNEIHAEAGTAVEKGAPLVAIGPAPGTGPS
jgi:biotin carboxyl carrier protein